MSSTIDELEFNKGQLDKDDPVDKDELVQIENDLNAAQVEKEYVTAEVKLSDGPENDTWKLERELAWCKWELFRARRNISDNQARIIELEKYSAKLSAQLPS